MDAERLENLLRFLAGSPSRRDIGRGMAGLALAGTLSTLFGLEDAEAKKKKRKKKCNPKCPSCKTCKKGKCKPKPNGTPCGAGWMCADGICVVDQGICAAGENACAGTGFACHRASCNCYTTTAEETRCGQGIPASPCGECITDGDCRSAYGRGAFCARGTAPGCGCPADKPNFCRKACPI